MGSIDSIDRILQNSEALYFPIIISADEYTSPWQIAQKFIVAGLAVGQQGSSSPPRYGAIYFAFTRTPDNIFDALSKIIDKQKPSDNSKMYVEWENLVIIDCYTQFAKRSGPRSYRVKF
jgi:hypothetical protein